MTPGLLLRPIVAGELDALHVLVESAYRGERARAGWTHEADLIEGPRTTRAELAALLDRPDERLLGAFGDGVLLGCVQLSRRAPDTVYLGLLSVDPARQAGGLGKAILAAAETHAVAAFGARRAELSVISLRTRLIEYYRRRGYTPTGELRPFPVPLDPPLSLLVMAKPIG